MNGHKNSTTSVKEMEVKDHLFACIESTEVEADYIGPRVTLPVTLLMTRSIIDHVKSGKVNIVCFF